MSDTDDISIPEPEPKVNITMTLRDDDTGNEVVQKIHLYSSEGSTVLKSGINAIYLLLRELGILSGVSDVRKERPGS